jgi:hypothetical protein
MLFETPDADKPPIEINDDYFFDAEHPNFIKRPPVLYFPYQRQFILSTQSGFAFDKYVRGVWARAHELIAKATEIHVIGYSFAGVDRGSVLDMLDTAQDCRRLIIQGPDAERICERLRLDRLRLRDLIEPAVFTF